MAELRGKGWCVVGYFIWMLGAGIALDGGSLRASVLLLTVGVAGFAIGAWQSRVQQVPVEGPAK